MSGLDWVAGELASWEASGLLRTPRVIETASAPEVEIDGRRVVLLCSNNYLGLADDPRVRAAAAACDAPVGDGDRRIAARVRDRRLCTATSSVSWPTSRGPRTPCCSRPATWRTSASSRRSPARRRCFSDELNHASIVDGCRLSKARVEVYRHADVDHLEELLASCAARRRIVVTDTVFSMDGDLAPLADLVGVCERHDAVLVVDEAHATGVLGPHGAGAVEELGLTDDVPVVVGTLSKALGSAGGYVATTTRSRNPVAQPRSLARVRHRTCAVDDRRSAGGSDIVEAEPERRDAFAALARHVADELRHLGYDAREPAAAVVPVHIGDAREAVALSERLLERGVFCPAIRPPSVPDGTSRLRVTVMATHTDEQIDRALEPSRLDATVHRGAACRAR